MKRETATELADAMERGFQIFTEAIGKPASKQQFEQILRVGVNYVAAFNPKHKDAAAITSKRGIIAYLLTQPEPTLTDKEKLKAMLLNLAPLLRKPALETFRSLPHQRRGQPPAFQNAQEEREAVTRVGTLLNYGDSLAEALNKTAHKYCISPRTMRRAWNRYKEQMREPQTRTAQ